MDPKLFPVLAVGVATAALAFYLGNGVLLARRKEQESAGLAVDASREETLRLPVAQRFFAPIVVRTGGFLARFTPVGWGQRTNKRLVYAGSPGNLDANAWAVVKFLTTIGALIVWFVAVAFFDLKINILSFKGVLFFGLTVALGFFGPDVVLNRRIDQRREAMRRQLPDILDLLVISVEAGLGFDAALARVVGTVPGPLSEEFFRMLQETRVGISRREAMRHLMDRTDLDELRSFLLAMMQAEAFGVAIARVLRVQADEMRVKRRQRAQEKAFAAPVKMVFPLVFCIFPALFIVLLGPAAIKIYETLVGL
ncbi:MAG: type II secretion system F family protein [Acidimicrobiia bacterium]